MGSFVNGTVTAEASTDGPLSSAALSTTTGNALIVAVVWNSDRTAAVTDTAGNSYSEAAGLRDGTTPAVTSGFRISIFIAHNVTGNASNVATATLSGGTTAATRIKVIQTQWSGLKKSAAFDVKGANSNSAATTITTASFTPAGSGETAVCVSTTSSNAGTYTQDSGYTLQNSDAQQTALQYKISIASGSQTTTMSWTNSANGRILTAVFLDEPATTSKYDSRLPDSFARRPWNPERSYAMKAPLIAAQAFAGVPIDFEQPDLFMRPRWRPPPAFEAYPTLTPDVAHPDIRAFSFSGPEAFARPAWNPPRGREDRWPGPNTLLVPPAPTPISPLQPDFFMRPSWNPEKTSIAVPRPPSSFLVTIPKDPVPPVLPASYMRPAWTNYERFVGRFPPPGQGATAPFAVLQVLNPIVDVNDTFEVLCTIYNPVTGVVFVRTVEPFLVNENAPAKLGMVSPQTPGIGYQVGLGLGLGLTRVEVGKPVTFVFSCTPADPVPTPIPVEFNATTGEPVRYGDRRKSLLDNALVSAGATYFPSTTLLIAARVIMLVGAVLLPQAVSVTVRYLKADHQ